MQCKKFRFGPIALTTTLTTNLLNPAAASGGVNAGSSGQFISLTHVRVVNKHASATGKVSLWLGATGANAAGTELFWQNVAIPAGSFIDWYGPGLRLDTADFLVGGADTASCLTIEGEGEVGVSG